MKRIAFYLLFAVAFAGSAFAQQSTQDTCLLKGRVCIVEDFEDLRVRVVNAFGDVRVDVVTTVWDDSECGQIELVNSFPYLRVKVVESLTEDITISFRDESSREKFMKYVVQSKKR